jgi:hypothetical protein
VTTTAPKGKEVVPEGTLPAIELFGEAFDDALL